MPRLATVILFSFFLCGMFSCSSTKNIAGRYATIFASGGFFGTTIILKKDSTLEYTFQGDLIYHHITGRYKVLDNKVYMTFDKELIDTNFGTKPFFSDTVYKKMYNKGTISYQSFCYVGHKKIFFSHRVTQKKVNKTTRFCKRKKYLFFGSHYYKRRWYLKKRDD